MIPHLRSLAVACMLLAPAQMPADERGEVVYKPAVSEENLPERYRMGEHKFAWEMERIKDLPVCGVEISYVRFPSLIETRFRENNTVWCEYYRPKGDGPFPGVIVLDILAGDQKLSRFIARQLAQNGIAALFVQMPYYGPRRAPGGPRLLSPNIDQTMAAIRQTTFDNRCATAWLASRKEVDPKRLGILGTSLGSFMSALTTAMEPRLNRVVLLLGGGGLVDAFSEHPKAKPYFEVAGLLGLDKERLKKMVAPADPLTYADALRQRQLLMIAASRDDIVPPVAAKRLWEATGKQKIIWLDATHVGAALFVFDVVGPIVSHFKGN